MNINLNLAVRRTFFLCWHSEGHHKSGSTTKNIRRVINFIVRFSRETSCEPQQVLKPHLGCSNLPRLTYADEKFSEDPSHSDA